MRLILLFAGMLALNGCIAGVAPIVGYPIGTTANHREEISSLPATRTRPKTTLYKQVIDHNYRLLFSPEGGRDNITLKHGYRYFVKVGDGEKTELRFLRSNPGIATSPAEPFDEVYPLPSRDAWIGYGLCSGEYPDSGYLENDTPAARLAAERHESRYFITLFSPEKQLSRTIITATTQKPGIRYLPDLRAIQFRSLSGMMLYLIDENRVVPKP
jgi:hypothetical protein